MTMWRDVPPPPARVPDPMKRARRGGGERTSFQVRLETTTPILGGAPVAREIDKIDIIRVPTIRGHLRSWWRALQSDTSTTELYRREAALWGQSAGETGGRSKIEITVEMQTRARVDSSCVEINSPAGYALWPARGTSSGAPTAERRMPGVRFLLTVSLPKDAATEMEVRHAVRAWILFGGYGSRTRRGLGSLTVVPRAVRSHADWLPNDTGDDEVEDTEIREALTDCFGGLDVFAGNGTVTTFPRLGGATLMVGARCQRAAEAAWKEALGWLREFRQGCGSSDARGICARDPGRGSRPGQSRWPEADKLRHLTQKYGHTARYKDRTPAWPRAVFGLPIVGQFKDSGEPDPFELRWRDENGALRDRMASPLIVKALPTTSGFRPCVLWLSRTFPEGKVVATLPGKVGRDGKPHVLSNSAATFGFSGTPEDQKEAKKLRSPLAHTDVRQAFLDWLMDRNVLRVVP